MFKKIGLSVLAVAIALPLAISPVFANAVYEPYDATGNTPRNGEYNSRDGRHSDGVANHGSSDSSTHRRAGNAAHTARGQHAFIHGFEDGNFHPDRALTRAEFAKMLHNLYGYRAGDNNHRNSGNHTAHRRGIIGQEGRSADGRGIIGQEGRYDGTRHYGGRHYDEQRNVTRNYRDNLYRYRDGHDGAARDGVRDGVRQNARHNSAVRNAANGVENVYHGAERAVRNTTRGVENTARNTTDRIDNAYRAMHNQARGTYRHNNRNNPESFNRTGATRYNPAAINHVNVDAATNNTRGARYFANVPDGHWARSEIDGIHRLGYFSRINTENFRADEPVTRSEFFAVLSHIRGERVEDENQNGGQIITRGEAVAVLHKVEGRSTEWGGNTRFHDVPESHAHHRYIMHAANGR